MPPDARPARAASALFLAAGAAACGADAPAAVLRRAELMGTSVALEVRGRSRGEALAASEAALRVLERSERRLSTWRGDTELARLNAAGVGEPFALSAELAAELSAARRWWSETGGAFDPGVGALVEAWGLRGSGRIPEAGDLRAALAAGGLALLELRARDDGGLDAVRLDAGLRLEEGGFGKGAALDAALAELRSRGIARARVDLGGQVAVLVPRDESAEVLVADPRARSRAVVELRIAEGSLSTSGNSERSLHVAGERIGHILDPRTGRPAPDFGSMSVWSPRALDADCLSTGLFVLGPDEALAWALAHPPVEVLAIECAGEALRARATPGFARGARVLVPDLRLEPFRPDPRAAPGASSPSAASNEVGPTPP